MSYPQREVMITGVVLKPQELILTLFGEYVDHGANLWSGGFVSVMEDLAFTTAGARIALNRVVSRGLFEVIKRGRRVYYRASPRLLDLLAQGERQAFWFRAPVPEWDGLWTTVWYTIPEEHRLARRRLSRRLAFLGFGALQDGSWIAPYDRSEELRRTIDEFGIAEFVAVFVGTTPTWISAQRLFAQAWDLNGAAARYASIIEKFGQFRSETARADLTIKEAFIVRTYLIEAVRQASALDP
jgi:phenylacetic acid degradation operon negative regulatory protein